MLQEHAAIFAKPESAVSAGADQGSERQNLWAQARNCLQDPLALREQINRSVTWLQSLPNKPMRLAVAHVADLYRNYYASELKGALAQVPSPAAYKPEKFQAGERVKHRFTTDFEAAAKSYRLESCFATGADEEAKADPTAASAEAEKQKPEDNSGKAPAASAGDKQEFRAEVEARVRKDLQARLVVLIKDGGHPELQASVTATELYQNLLSTGCRFMGVYDPKNARLCDVFTGESWAQRVPVLDETDLQLFVDTMSNIMKPGMDFCWLLSGRLEQGEKGIKDLITKKGWKYKQFTTVVDYRAMQRYYWRRQAAAGRGQLPNGREAVPLLVTLPAQAHAARALVCGRRISPIRGGHEHSASGRSKGLGLRRQHRAADQSAAHGGSPGGVGCSS